MKLDDLQGNMNSQQLANLLKKHHGIEIPLDKLTPTKATRMLENVQKNLLEHRNSSKSHISEKDQNYTALMLIEQALSKHLNEFEYGSRMGSISDTLDRVLPGERPNTPGYAKTIGKTFANFKNRGKDEKEPEENPSVATASQVTKLPQNYLQSVVTKDFSSLSPNDRNSLAKALHTLIQNPQNATLFGKAIKAQVNESIIMESALGEAEVILAAKDLTDRVQDMVETLGKMINEEIPALTETIRDIMGEEKGDTYTQSATQSLNSLLDLVRSTKDAMDSAARVLAGEQTADMGSETDLNTDLSGMGMDAEAGISPEETGQQLLNAPDASKGGQAPLGRQKR